MLFDNGTLELYKTVNAAAPGAMPVEQRMLAVKACYSERVVGYGRFFTAMQADSQADLLLRIPRSYEARVGMIARLYPYSHQDQSEYRVIQVQDASDDEGGIFTDLTLTRLEGLNV